MQVIVITIDELTIKFDVAGADAKPSAPLVSFHVRDGVLKAKAHRSMGRWSTFRTIWVPAFQHGAAREVGVAYLGP
ncbi:hypothetical protein AXW83_04450 [Bosea sp. PAMC 26642]|nr:hypothetical protein AXW83_04450 [Bosea sp. PAMC 26642]